MWSSWKRRTQEGFTGAIVTLLSVITRQADQTQPGTGLRCAEWTFIYILNDDGSKKNAHQCRITVFFTFSTFDEIN